jgi:hypothetical protein
MAANIKATTNRQTRIGRNYRPLSDDPAITLIAIAD